MKAILLLALLPALAFGQVLSRPGGSGTFTAPVTTPGVVSTGTVQTKGLVSTVLATPVNATFTATTGTLNNGTYYYRVSALDAAGETLASTETSLTVSGGAASNGIVVVWGAVTGATSYKVYGRSTGAELLMATVTAPAVTWTDTGSVTPSGALPSLGTSGNISTTSGVTARDLTTSAVSGAVALSMATGSKLCLDSNCQYNWTASNGTVLSSAAVQASSFQGRDPDTGGVTILTYATVDAAKAAITFTGINAAAGALTVGELIRMNNSTTKVAAILPSGMPRFGIGNTAAAPTCDATQRNTLWIVNGGAGVTDTVSVCLKAAADTYSWVTITTGG